MALKCKKDGVHHHHCFDLLLDAVRRKWSKWNTHTKKKGRRRDASAERALTKRKLDLNRWVRLLVVSLLSFDGCSRSGRGHSMKSEAALSLQWNISSSSSSFAFFFVLSLMESYRPYSYIYVLYGDRSLLLPVRRVECVSLHFYFFGGTFFFFVEGDETSYHRKGFWGNQRGAKKSVPST